MISRRKEIAFLAGFMGLFALAATIHATTGVFLTFYIEEYSLDGALQGLCGTAESIGFIISLLISAALLRLMPKTRVILIMALLMAVVLPGIGLYPSRFLFLCLWYVLFGVSYGIFDSLSSSLLSDIYPEKSAGMMSYMRAVYCLGGMVSPMLLNALLSAGIAWHRVAFITGLIGLGLFAFYFLFASGNIPPVKMQSADRITLKEISSFLKIKGAVRTLLFGLMYYGHQIGLTVWIVRYISNYLNEPIWGGYALTFYWVGALLARIVLPNLVGGHKRLLVFGNTCSAVFFITGILIGNGKLMCLLILLVGFAEGTTIPMLVDHACSLDRSRSTVACSVVIFTNNCGSIVIPSVIGAVIAALGANVGIFVLPALSVTCAVMATAFRDSSMSQIQKTE